MTVHEFFLEGPVEPFTVGVHLGRPRIRVPMDDPVGFEDVLKMEHELAPVVREDALDLGGKGFEERGQDPGRLLGGMTPRAKGEGESRIDIDEGHDIHSASLPMELDGIEPRTFKWLLWDVSFGFPLFWRGFSHLSPAPAAWEPFLRPHPVGSVMDEPADGGNGGTKEPLPVAVLLEKGVNFLLSNIRVFETDDLDLTDDIRGPQTNPSPARSPVFRV